MPLELDHFLTFVIPEFKEKEKLEKAGLILSPPVTHLGQGTSSQTIFFKENALEWLWLNDEAEAKNSPLNLFRRAYWQVTDSCPFGIGLRGTVNDFNLGDYELYEPKHDSSQRIWIHPVDRDYPMLPLVYIVEMQYPGPGRQWWSETRFKSQEMYKDCFNPYPCITRIKLSIPHPIPDLGMPAEIEVVKGDSFKAEVYVIDLPETIDVSEHVKLISDDYDTVAT